MAQAKQPETGTPEVQPGDDSNESQPTGGVRIRYNGPADIRKISKADLKSEAGIEHDAVEWTVKNRFETSVSEELANYLTGTSPEQFSVVEDKA